jgi:hypothetical protein
MNTVRIKRRVSGAAGAPASLANAELAFNEVDRVLYYGFGDNGSGGATSVQAIGGGGAFVSLATAQTVSGVKTFDGLVTCTAVIPPNDNTDTVATTKWVLTKIGSISSGVTTWNGRSGAVTFLASDITGALGYTPVNYSLPTASASVLGGVKVGNGIAIAGDGTISANIPAGGVTSFNTRTGAVTLVSGDITPITDPLYLSPNTANATYLKLTGGTVTGALVVSGDLTINGTTTTVNAINLDVADKNITLGKVASPTDATATGGGITLLGTTNKTFMWESTPAAWLSSENMDLANAKAYLLAGVSVLSATNLGDGVINSNLSKVGTITTGTWNGTVIDVAHGGTGVATITGLVKGNGVSAFTAAIAGTDYLAPSSIIDGGTF